MSPRWALRLAGLAMAAGLAGCASPYQHALENPRLERPEPPMNASDQQALEPYQNAPWFRD